MLFFIAVATLPLSPPLITRMTKKSPMTSVTTKIEPSAMPVRDSGAMTSFRIVSGPAPASTAASTTDGLILAIALKIGASMNNVNRCT